MTYVPEVPSVGTNGADYSDFYYQHDCGLPYDAESEHWLTFFGTIADRLVAMFHPTSALDAGCAKGILVGSLVERGVDAQGIDISPSAIADCDPRAAGRVQVGSLTAPIEGRYDLVTCIEVVEHMSQPDVEVALDNLCAVTELLVLSSSPWDLKEATHVNVRAAGHWAAMLLDRGFVRRFDVDLSFITPWAVAYQRRDAAARELVREYENEVTALRTEVSDKRLSLLAAQRRIGELGGLEAADAERQALSEQVGLLEMELQRKDDLARSLEERAQSLEDQLRERTLALLSSRDAARGFEATAGTMQRRAAALQHEVDLLRADLHAVRASGTWRIGWLILSPVRVLKRLMGRPV